MIHTHHDLWLSSDYDLYPSSVLYLTASSLIISENLWFHWTKNNSLIAKKHRPRAGSSQAEAKAPINRSCEAKNRTAGGRAGWQQETPGNAASERGAQSPESRGPVKTGKRPLPRTRSCLERSCTSAEVRPSQESRNYGISAPFLMLPVNPITWASAKGVPDTCGQRTLTETQVLRPGIPTINRIPTRDGKYHLSCLLSGLQILYHIQKVIKFQGMGARTELFISHIWILKKISKINFLQYLL